MPKKKPNRDLRTCAGCTRDTRHPTGLCAACRGGEADDAGAEELARRRAAGQRPLDDDAGREADDGWAYADLDLPPELR